MTKQSWKFKVKDSSSLKKSNALVSECVLIVTAVMSLPCHLEKAAQTLLKLSSQAAFLFSAESDYTHDAFCMSECRKEKDEREYYCYSEFGM